ncbi:MAG TPA: zinc-binding dehydrogenase [Streptosporangiaceae bacterium]
MSNVTAERAWPLDTEGMDWIPTGPGKSFRPLRFAEDGWSELMRLEPGSVVGLHRHTGDVHAFNLSGTREIIGTGEIVGPGGYVYEPPGTIDIWGAVGDVPCVVHIKVTGAVEYLDDDGHVTETVNAQSQRAIYLRWCQQHNVKPAHAMTAMRASSSNPASLVREMVPVPDVEPGELLVEVRATAITAQELTWQETWPVIPCHDLSGVVAATGPGVTGWRGGDQAYGLVGFDRPGAAAEYVTVPAADLAPKPPGISHAGAAAIPLGALTAWQALHEHAQLRPGQHVLVHGGGGVGCYAVQLAALAGARVTATASARDSGAVASLGAGEVLDYARGFADRVRDIDIVIDPVGGATMAESWQVLRPGGILVAIAESPPDDHGGRTDVRGVYFVVRPDGEQLRELAALVGHQQLHPVVSDVFELSTLADAFRAQRSRSAPGKVVVTVADTR